MAVIHSSLCSASFSSTTKSIKWSPDGSCLLTADDDNDMHLFEFPSSPELVSSSWQKNLAVHEGETIYDFCWYPAMSSSNPITCCFASSSRDHPIHLWDAFTGQLRATYRGYDHLDEIGAAYSICFSADSQSLLSGANNCIRVFDVALPGRQVSVSSHTSDVILCFPTCPRSYRMNCM
jgi:WD40 repeat protein